MRRDLGWRALNAAVVERHMAGQIEMDCDHDHVGIAVSGASRPGIERVPAQRLKNGDWQLIRSPLYAMQAAAGDVIRMLDCETGAFEVMARGGNVSVQFYLGEREADDAQATERAARDIASELMALGGRMDGMTAGLIVFSVPSKAGFAAIENALEAAVLRHHGSQWQYGNVYDSVSGEPLSWWENK